MLWQCAYTGMEFQRLQDDGWGRVNVENFLPATYGAWTLFSSCLGQLEDMGGLRRPSSPQPDPEPIVFGFWAHCTSCIRSVPSISHGRDFPRYTLHGSWSLQRTKPRHLLATF